MTVCAFFHMTKRQPYTREQLIELILLHIQLQEAGIDCNWSSHDGEDGFGDEYVHFYLLMNDMWGWGCADSSSCLTFNRYRERTSYNRGYGGDYDLGVDGPDGIFESMGIFEWGS